MTKIKLLNFGASDCRSYKGATGTEYVFNKGRYVEVTDPRDALMFLKAGNGTLFEAEGSPKNILKTLEAAVKKLLKGDESVDEESPPEETGALEPTAEDLAAAEGEAAPIDGDKPSEEQPKESEQPKAMTAEKLTKLNKEQQTFIIKKVDDKLAIPKLEKGRVELLMKLQSEGANLSKILQDYKE